MRVVVTLGIRNLPSNPQPLHELYRDYLEEAVLAEALGFDAFGPVSTISRKMRGTRRRSHFWRRSRRAPSACGSAPTCCLPFHNPVRVAEDIAVLDNISRGRVDLPVGVGSAPEEFRTFGVSFNERLGRTFEALRVIERCFAGERFSHRGKYYEFPDVHMTTTPVQRPGPPIWVASMGEQSVTWTARRGYHLAAGAGRGHAKYEELLSEFGHDRSARQVASIPIRVHIAETRDQAWDEAEAGLHQVLHFYRTRVDMQAATGAAGILDRLPPVGEFRNVPSIGHRGTPFVVGTPEDMAQALAGYRDKHLTHLCLNFHQPGMATAAVRRAMETFAKQIMPVVKRW